MEFITHNRGHIRSSDFQSYEVQTRPISHHSQYLAAEEAPPCAESLLMLGTLRVPRTMVSHTAGPDASNWSPKQANITPFSEKVCTYALYYFEY